MTFNLLLPEISLFCCAVIVLVADMVTSEARRHLLGYLSCAGILVTMALLFTGARGETSIFGAMFTIDAYQVAFSAVFLGSAFLAILSSIDYVKARIEHKGEFFGLILLATTGMMFLAAARELLALYVSLELTTISLFVLAAYAKKDLKSTEAGLKYLILGAASSAILLYGISLIYGITRTTYIDSIYATFYGFYHGGPLLIISMVLLVAGFSFKLAAVPFHMWAPDVYEGAPTPITAYLSVASKAAGLAAMVRLFFGGLLPLAQLWLPLLLVLSALSMLLGNIVAVRQTNIKRMMAYSSIAHIGYILIGLVALSELSTTAMLLYLVVYMFANLGAFAVIICFFNSSGSDEISAYSGLSRRSPLLAISLVVFFLSLVGLPPTGGFIGKYYLFMAAIQAKYYWLVILGVLTSVVSLYYYFNVARQMYFSKAAAAETVSVPTSMKLVLVLALVGTIGVGVYPNPLLRMLDGVSKVFLYKPF